MIGLIGLIVNDALFSEQNPIDFYVSHEKVKTGIGLYKRKKA